LEIVQGLTMHHAPGHTPGLCILQVNMLESGTWISTSDQYHVRENYEDGHPQGWLARDHDDWVRSNQMIHMLARRTNAKVVLGHDKEVCCFERAWMDEGLLTAFSDSSSISCLARSSTARGAQN